MKESNEFRIFFVSTNSFENAMHISRILISEKLAACCSVIQNANSIYEWEGQIVERVECILMIKTKIEKINTLENRILELHTDKVPEIISVKINEISENYMNWMNKVLVN